MIEETASSIGELIKKTKQIASAWSQSPQDPQELWFRGQPQAEFGLLPGLYRPAVQKYHYEEVGLFERFKALATPYIRRQLPNEWEWYFLAQHFGLPTRLLDWTESLLAATYFAACESIFCADRLRVDDEIGKGKQRPIFDEKSPVVWILDAGWFNKTLHDDDALFTPSEEGDFTAKYLPGSISADTQTDNELPLAILPPRTNERITAQQGVFTIHGHSHSSLEALAIGGDHENSVQLARILLDRANLCHIWIELQITGVNRLALFPDIDSVATYVKWIMQSAK